MGNSAIVKQAGKSLGVYLHWNGGRDSVEAFLKYCEIKGYQGFDTDYGFARFVQVVSNFFGGSNSIGIESNVKVWDYKGLDNGIYEVRDHAICGRFPIDITEQGYHELQDMLIAIDEKQPQEEQLGDYLTSEEVSVKELNIGDKVFYKHWDGKVTLQTVLGFGDDEIINGRNVKGVPFIDYYNNGTPKLNVNNYVFEEIIRRKEEVAEEDLVAKF